jgi:hypothetical protein
MKIKSFARRLLSLGKSPARETEVKIKSRGTKGDKRSEDEAESRFLGLASRACMICPIGRLTADRRLVEDR